MCNKLKFTVIFVSSLFCCNLLLAQKILQPLQIGVYAGYERQNLDWSIAGNSSGQSPNIYSELKWKGVSGPALSASFQYTFWRKFAVMGSYSHGFIRLGSVTDNDYNGNNRTGQVYDQTFNSNKGSINRWNAAAGYELINNDKYSLVPFVGYEVSRQSLSILDLTGNFPELNSNYNPVWKGVLLKARAQLRLNHTFKLTGDVGYTQLKYKSTADWNIIQTFQHPVSYRHTANGYKVSTDVALACRLTKNIAVTIGGGYFTMATGNGIDELYLASGGVEKTQLNGVNNAAFRLFGGLLLNY